MNKYFVLSVDSFVTAFSLADTTSAIRFKYSKSGSIDNCSVITSGDQILVYRRKPCGTINILLEAITKDTFKKKYETCNGVVADIYLVGKNIEDEEIIEINEQSFNKIMAELTTIDFAKKNEKISTDSAPRITGAENILLYGVPGAGKSYTIKEEYCDDPDSIERVVFHPDYTYSDFVGQILPRVFEGQMKYVFSPGPFTKILKKAWENPSNKYYLIIEEINRGNAPAIFGEIFQLLDRKEVGNRKYPSSETGESEYGITNFDVATAVFGDENHEIRIPSNLWILATMNTADQNVFTLDTAFQRRWDMRHIKNDVMNAEHSNVKIEGSEIQWGAFASVINDMVIDLSMDLTSSEDKRLGAYFVKLNELTVTKFSEKVLKYLWDDAFKMDKEAVFDDKFKSLEGVIDTYEHSDDDKLRAVLRIDVYRRMIEKMQQNE